MCEHVDECAGRAADQSEPQVTRRRALTGVAVGAGVIAATSLIGAPAAYGYNWTRTLRQGMSGSDVRELQVRVAGFAASGASRTYIAIDGAFGPATHGAVRRFQSAWGLGVDGIAGPQTQGRLNALEGAPTAHFAWSEFHSRDGSGFSGGRVGAATVQANVRVLAWKLEAVRRKGGNNAIIVNSGFRSINHNRNVGGASNSQHMYGITADFRIANRSVSQAISYCQSSGFSGIIRYSSFTHADSRVQYPYGAQSWYWSV